MTPDRNILTAHRQRILGLWLIGYTYRQIAFIMDVKVKTVNVTLYNIRDILTIYNRYEIFEWAYNNGIIQETLALNYGKELV